MREDEFGRYADRAGQFTDGHEGIIFGIDHNYTSGPQLSASKYSVDFRELRSGPRDAWLEPSFRLCATGEGLEDFVARDARNRLGL